MAHHAWRNLALTGLLSTGIAVGCVVSSGDPDGTSNLPDAGGTGGQTATGGSGGSTSGGSTSGGSTSGGATASGGAGGVIEGATCNDADPGQVGTTCEPDSTNACQVCVQANCCDEFEACLAEGPKDVCGWDEASGEFGGEYLCWLSCIENPCALGVTEPGTELLAFPYTPEAYEACLDYCGEQSMCGVSEKTNALAACIRDDEGADDDDTNCQEECLDPPLDYVLPAECE